jgi:hypothetical protein
MSAFTVPVSSNPSPLQSSEITDPFNIDEDFDYGIDDALLLEEEEQHSQQQQLPPPPHPSVNAHAHAAALASQVDTTKKILSSTLPNGSVNPLLNPSENSHYILGTLIVRVVSGRDVPAAIAGGFGQVFTGGSNDAQKKNKQPRSQRVLRMLSSGTSNPFCRVR